MWEDESLKWSRCSGDETSLFLKRGWVREGKWSLLHYSIIVGIKVAHSTERVFFPISVSSGGSMGGSEDVSKTSPRL